MDKASFLPQGILVSQPRVVEHLDTGVSLMETGILPSSCISCWALGKSFNLSEPQFPHLKRKGTLIKYTPHRVMVEEKCGLYIKHITLWLEL